MKSFLEETFYFTLASFGLEIYNILIYALIIVLNLFEVKVN